VRKVEFETETAVPLQAVWFVAFGLVLRWKFFLWDQQNSLLRELVVNRFLDNSPVAN